LKTKVSPAVVGFFVLGALVLGLVGLLSFGNVNFFSKPQRFMVYFDETIHGLDLGSPVKLRGVRVGRVTRINLRYIASENKSMVAVLCELNRGTVLDERGQEVDLSDPADLQMLIDRGLHAQLGVVGLATGLLYVELDFVEPEQAEQPSPPPLLDTQYVVVPAVPSTIAEFQASLTSILSDVRRIDFAGLGREMRGLLVDTRRKINAVDTAALTQEWTQAARAINEFAASGKIETTLENLNGAIADLRTTLAHIDGLVEPAGTELQATLQQARTTLATFNDAAHSAQQFIHAQSGLGSDAAIAMQQLAEAAQSVARLVDFLERNPNALLTGRAGPRP
jgi:paraquat-inducible protein B